MSFKYFEAESHVSTYNQFRPSPPQSLIEKIIQFSNEKESNCTNLAVDVGCGSGQSTEVLAPYFKKVLGLDLSDEILNEARKKCHHVNVIYSLSSGEKINMEDESVDLITVGQALHWLDIPKFYSEANRILKSNGVLAVYGYELPEPVIENNSVLSSIIKDYYVNILASFTLPQSRQAYIGQYKSKEFNEVHFIEGKKMQRYEDYILEIKASLKDIIGYVSSWSAFQNYTKQLGKESGEELLRQFEDEFKSALGSGDADSLRLRFKYFLLIGRKE